MNRLNVLVLLVVSTMLVACSKTKNEPLIPIQPNQTEKSSGKDKEKDNAEKGSEENGAKDKEKDGTKGTEDNGKPSNPSNKGEEGNANSSEQSKGRKTKAGFYLLKSIEEYKGKQLVDKIAFAYDEADRLSKITFSAYEVNLKYTLVNSQVSKIDFLPTNTEDFDATKFLLTNGKISSMSSKREAKECTFAYEGGLLKDYTIKEKAFNAVHYVCQWNEDASLILESSADTSTEYASSDIKNNVYPDLNYILNTAEERDYLTDYMGRRSKYFFNSVKRKPSKVEYRYTYKFDTLARPIEVQLTTLQGGQDLGSQIFRLTYY